MIIVLNFEHIPGQRNLFGTVAHTRPDKNESAHIRFAAIKHEKSKK